MSNMKKLLYILVYICLYISINVAVGHPLFYGIHVDFGYFPMMVLCVAAGYIGVIPGVVCGTAGYTLYSVFFSKEGFSLGLFAAILIVSASVAWCCKKSHNNVFIVTAAVVCSVAIGALVSTAIECCIFPLPVYDELLENAVSGIMEIFILVFAYIVTILILAVLSGDELPEKK